MPQGWDNFFFMIGSASAGLVGLLFVIVTLTAGIERSRALRGARLYMTPTAVLFCIVLSVCAVALAPGLPAWAMAALVFFIALVGLANGVRSCLGIARMSLGADAPHWSDFWMYGVTPAAICLGLCAAALAIAMGQPLADYALAGLLLALLLAAIRNAWDLVTWMAPSSKVAG